MQSHVLIALAALALLAPASARADFTSDLTGSDAVMTGDGEADRLEIDASGAFLRHNRFASGDAGFDSALDFDSADPGEQKLANAGTSSLSLDAGLADDLIYIGSASAPASTIAASVSANGGAQETSPGDFLGVFDGTDATGRVIDVTASGVDGYGGGGLSHLGFERITVTAGSGADVVTVGAGVPQGGGIPPFPDWGTAIQAGSGADRIALAEGVTAGINGGAGNDTLDYGAWTTPVTYRARQQASLYAFMTGTEVAPPNDVASEGSATLDLDLATNEFDFDALVTDLGRDEVIGSAIHAAPPAQDGPIVFDVGGGDLWTDEVIFLDSYIRRTITGATFPAASVDDLLTGNTYFQLHTTTFPGGEIRGQLQVERTSMFGLENVIGGSAGDTLAGDGLVQHLDGGPGNDLLLGGDGNDVLLGGTGGDELVGRLGEDDLFGQGSDDVLRSNEREADATLNCGAGAGDVANRDPPAIDPDSILSGCEIVKTESTKDLSASGANASDPRVATDADGDAIAVWRRSDGANQRVEARTVSAAGGLGAVRRLSPAGQNATAPQVATDSGGDAIAVWRRSDGVNQRIEARTISAAGALGAVKRVSAAGQHAFEPRVATDPDGDAIAVWRRSDGANQRIQARTVSAAGVLGPVKTLSPAGQHATAPQVAIDGEGDAIAVWRRSDGANQRIEARTLSAAGALGAVKKLSNAGRDAADPRVATDADGDAIAVWRRSDGTNQRVQAATITAAGALGFRGTLSTAGQDAISPRVATDADGDAIAAWQRSDGAHQRIQARAISAAGISAGLLGTTQTLSDAGQDATAPQVAIDAGGDAIAVWQRSDGGNQRVQARTIWSVADLEVLGNVRNLSAATQDAVTPQVATDDDGDAIGVWRRSDGTSLRIQARVGLS